jgi:hypothetical protein
LSWQQALLLLFQWQVGSALGAFRCTSAKQLCVLCWCLVSVVFTKLAKVWHHTMLDWCGAVANMAVQHDSRAYEVVCEETQLNQSDHWPAC